MTISKGGVSFNEAAGVSALSARCVHMRASELWFVIERAGTGTTT